MNVDFKLGKHVSVVVDNLEEVDPTQGMSGEELFTVINHSDLESEKSQRPGTLTGSLFSGCFSGKR